MGNTQELRFQGLCLKSMNGSDFMCQVYDLFPKLVRDRLKQSDYNICAACVKDATRLQMQSGAPPEVPDYLSVITAMEQQLKCEEVAVCEPF